MNKRMIDADALLRWVKATKGLFDDETLDDFYSSTLNKINELATPALEPQESIFDADGWCWDMDSLHSHENVILYITSPDLKTKRATTGMRIGKEFYFARISERDRPNAWKPLPLPKDKS